MGGLDLRELLCFISVYQKTYSKEIPFSAIQEEREKSALPWLEDIKSVFEILSDNSFVQTNIWVIKDSQPVLDYGQTFHVVTNTIKLIEYAYLLEDVTDAYLLLRRIFESILQYLFFHIIRERARSENLEINNENMDKMFDAYFFDNTYSTDKSKMNYWATNTKLDENQRKQRRRSITIQNYMQTLNREFPILENCLTRFFSKTIKFLMRKMDDFTHGNELGNYTQKLAPQEMIQNDTLDLTAIILSYISLINAGLLKSDDYAGAMEFGMTPEEGRRAWIAPAFSDFFDTFIDPKYPGLREFLNENNSAGMDISDPSSD